MAPEQTANRIRQLIPDEIGRAFCADPQKYGNSSVFIVVPGEQGPRVQLMTVTDVTEDEEWFARAVGSA